MNERARTSSHACRGTITARRRSISSPRSNGTTPAASSLDALPRGRRNTCGCMSTPLERRASRARAGAAAAAGGPAYADGLIPAASRSGKATPMSSRACRSPDAAQSPNSSSARGSPRRADRGLSTQADAKGGLASSRRPCTPPETEGLSEAAIRWPCVGKRAGFVRPFVCTARSHPRAPVRRAEALKTDYVSALRGSNSAGPARTFRRSDGPVTSPSTCDRESGSAGLREVAAIGRRRHGLVGLPRRPGIGARRRPDEGTSAG